MVLVAALVLGLGIVRARRASTRVPAIATRLQVLDRQVADVQLAASGPDCTGIWRDRTQLDDGQVLGSIAGCASKPIALGGRGAGDGFGSGNLCGSLQVGHERARVGDHRRSPFALQGCKSW